ncbi:head-tail connector protein [Citrobacter enshiensis]|uniref:head-tail connector protein n=1 Tax=Citrobacter enshiensis TaxID=2971264 RepID=UPI0023E88A3D|nr:head-tail connector protein [Citrobacter enshiensis]WET42504.1 head-tail connector protein [Citrobacter enshiensis]
MILTNEEIKRQLRLEDDDTSEDVLLSALGAAVESRTSTFLNRPLYAKADDIPDGDTRGLVVSNDIRLAMLMLVTHFYENRSATSEVEKLETPQAYNWLVSPYRFYPR